MTHLVGEGAEEVHVDDFTLVVQDLWSDDSLLEVHPLLLHADGTVVSDELGHLAVQILSGILPSDGFNGLSHSPMAMSVVQLDHTRVQAWGGRPLGCCCGWWQACPYR